MYVKSGFALSFIFLFNFLFFLGGECGSQDVRIGFDVGSQEVNINFDVDVAHVAGSFLYSHTTPFCPASRRLWASLS